MLLWLLLKAALMGIVEGLTEFLPISSTGHLILVGSLLGFHDERGKVFEVAIQTGAMFAIIWEYRERFLRFGGLLRGDPVVLSFARNIVVAFLPAAALGFLLGKHIKAVLFHPVPVAMAFIVGGLIILWAERRPQKVRVESVDSMTMLDALKVGVCQAAALVPGTSRSGATIIGGMLCGLSRQTATEFSFFLAVPTLMAAGAYDLIKHRELLSVADIPVFLVGGVTAMFSAFLCVRWLLRYISRHDFTIFVWYRLAFGVLILLTAYMGWVDWSNG
jgi:undecaprenyl-diphosphatase